MFTDPKKMILHAQKEGYAVGCFNTSDLEITKAIIKAAEAQQSPVLVATSEKAIEYAGLDTIAAIIKEEGKDASVPVGLHLDHGKSLEIVRECLKEGYTSIMFDGSSMEFRENIDKTRQAMEMARSQHTPCEGELGALGKAGKNESKLTNPDEVAEFVKETSVDWLAVSVGSKHGISDKEDLDIELLKKIHSIVDTPLVLHGASGVSDIDIRDAIENGICKINIDTDIRHTYSFAMRRILQENPHEQDFRKILSKAMIDIQKLVESKIRLFGSNDKI